MNYQLRKSISNPIPGKFLENTESKSITSPSKRTAKTSTRNNSTKPISLAKRNSNLIAKQSFKPKSQTRSSLNIGYKSAANSKSNGLDETRNKHGNIQLNDQDKIQHKSSIDKQTKIQANMQDSNLKMNLEQKSNEEIDKSMDMDSVESSNISSRRNPIANSKTESTNGQNVDSLNGSLNILNDLAEINSKLSKIKDGFECFQMSIDHLNKKVHTQEIAIRFLEAIMNGQMSDQRFKQIIQHSIQQLVQLNQLETDQLDKLNPFNLINRLQVNHQTPSLSPHFHSPTFNPNQCHIDNSSEQSNPIDVQQVESIDLSLNKRNLQVLTTTTDQDARPVKKLKVNLPPRNLRLSKPVRRINRINSGITPIKVTDYATRSITYSKPQSLDKIDSQEECSNRFNMDYLSTANDHLKGTELIYNNNIAYTVSNLNACRKLEEELVKSSVLDLSIKEKQPLVANGEDYSKSIEKECLELIEEVCSEVAQEDYHQLINDQKSVKEDYPKSIRSVCSEPIEDVQFQPFDQNSMENGRSELNKDACSEDRLKPANNNQKLTDTYENLIYIKNIPFEELEKFKKEPKIRLVPIKICPICHSKLNSRIHRCFFNVK